jgi:protein TonB
MTFYRSIFISLGIHLLVWGGALAFAQYGNILGIRSDMIMVSLVGSGPVATARDQDEEKAVRKQSRKRVVSERVLQQNEVQTVATARAAHTILENSASDNHGGDKENKMSDAKPTIQGIGGEVGSRSGIVTPEQWQLIQAALERAKTYPRTARERGIEGVVHVRFKVLPSGTVEHVEILKSSGSEILDSASIRTVYRSGPLPHVSGWVDVPISYAIVK